MNYDPGGRGQEEYCAGVDSEEAVRSARLADIGAKPMVSVQLEEQVDSVQ